MYSSIADTVKGLAAAIEAAQPVTWPDRGFTVARLATGEDLEDWIRAADRRRIREVVIRPTALPAPGSSLCYLVGELTVEVCYPCSIPEDVRAAMIFDDAVTIIRAIAQSPARWGGAENVYPASAGQVETCFDDAGRPLLYVAIIPFSVIIS